MIDARIGKGLAEVPIDAGGPQDRAGDAVRVTLVGGDHPHPLGALEEDRIGAEQVLVLGYALGNYLEDLGDVVLPAVGKVGGDAAGSDVVVVHPQPGGLLEEVEELLPLPEP